MGNIKDEKYDEFLCPAPIMYKEKNFKSKWEFRIGVEKWDAMVRELTPTQLKVMMVLMCTMPGRSVSVSYMLDHTGINRPSAYFKARKELVDKGWLECVPSKPGKPGKIIIKCNELLRDYEDINPDDYETWLDEDEYPEVLKEN